MNREKVKEVFPKVIEQIAQDPMRYNQRRWPSLEEIDCGTACCIGAKLQALIGDTGCLALTPRERDVLFTASPVLHWPEPYAEQWLRTLALSDPFAMHTEQARIASAFLTEIMETGVIRGA